MNKLVLRPQRLRLLPAQFSWIDQTLARQRFFQRAPAEAWALYCFLVTVADAQGLSYYADRTLCQRLALSSETLERARQALIALELIAVRVPLVQVLAVPSSPPSTSSPRTPKTQALAHLAQLHQVLGKAGAR
ncbi:MAG: hypothetical protein HKO07_03530 [Pseudomonadales bacterium]|nr:hypothetical protein [Pseudomonadales bacterium]